MTQTFKRVPQVSTQPSGKRVTHWRPFLHVQILIRKYKAYWRRDINWACTPTFPRYRDAYSYYKSIYDTTFCINTNTNKQHIYCVSLYQTTLSLSLSFSLSLYIYISIYYALVHDLPLVWMEGFAKGFDG